MRQRMPEVKEIEDKKMSKSLYAQEGQRLIGCKQITVEDMARDVLQSSRYL